MFEETNQTEERPDEFFDDIGADILPDDADDAEENHTDEDADVQPEEAAEDEDKPEPAPETEPKYRVKYNGEERELTVSELITNAQKGMNYDHVLSERDALKQSPAVDYVNRYAKRMGMTPEQYVTWVEQQEQEQDIQKQITAGVPEEYARRMAELENKERHREELEVAQKKEAEKRKQYADFVRVYPDVRSFPAEVIQAIEAGDTPTHAYQAYENKLLKEQLAAERKNKKNEQKSPGSVRDNGGAAAGDDFMTGFFH